MSSDFLKKVSKNIFYRVGLGKNNIFEAILTESLSRSSFLELCRRSKSFVVFYCCFSFKKGLPGVFTLSSFFLKEGPFAKTL